MKRFYSLLMALLVACASHSQAVLNEIYSFPNAGNHEFFELYNTSTSGVPVSVDGYYLVTYFAEGNKEGFYVMDLPNVLVDPKGYFVGSSNIPFNYQGNMNSTKSDFSWNDPTFRDGSTSGYLKKWVRSNKVAGDGNPDYDEEAVPNDFNDFFSKVKGAGASFNTFVFRDGIMVNAFLGGTGGSNLIPSYITAMPPLYIQSVTQLNGNIPRTIDFNEYDNMEAENVIQDIGSDNGYMRTRDGMCGTWLKSSSQAFHTPQSTNGTLSQMDVVGSITIETHISRGFHPDDYSSVTYNITAGPTNIYPVEILIYADNGTVDDQWDADDDFIGSNTETVVTDGPFTTLFSPQDMELIMVVKTDMGCYDQVRLIRNPEPELTALPLKLKAFTGKAANNRAMLEWVVSSNESGEQFEVERSANGREFSAVGRVATTTRTGEEYYTFQEALGSSAYYRLKLVNRDGTSTFSPVVFVKEHTATAEKLFIVQNPVEASLVFTYQSTQTGQNTVNVYNAIGVKLFRTQKAVQKGSNTYSINLDPKFTSGTYILEVVNNTERSVERFIRR